MRQSRTFDVSTGLFVLLGFVAIGFLVTQITSREFGIGGDSYRLHAQFENVGGLKTGAPVKMAGVTIGRVEGIAYDMKLLKAVVTLRIDRSYDEIPNDSDTSIFTAGLLGEQYVALEPGGAVTNLKPGDRIQLTQSALVMEQIIGQFLYSSAARDTPEPEAEPGTAGP